MYIEKDLVRIGKRENNKKRNYLVVNALQGKHIPVAPQTTLEMFDSLAEQLKQAGIGDGCLFIGFAETATAIGAAVASNFDAYYMQTTREQIENAEYLFFSEEHSHATEQKLVKNDLDCITNRVEHIIFVEDEITTGKTILNIIDILKKRYPEFKRYSVISILNGMNEEAIRRYQERKIGIHYLIKTEHSTYPEIAQKYQGNGVYVACNPLKCNEEKLERIHIKEYYKNARKMVGTLAYKESVKKFIQEVLEKEILQKIECSNTERILVVGTEEFMYPAIAFGAALQEKGYEVRTHSTTRSPIEVDCAAEYPLHERYELRSLYDENRITYLYDIASYDYVFIVSDTELDEGPGLNSLINAVLIKNKKICFIRWCER